DTPRLAVQQFITQSWGQLEAAKAQVDSSTAQVTSSEIALDGVREEARVGQRTTLDVLTAQQAWIVASYAGLASVGSLSPQIFGLHIEAYDPIGHYQQVRDNLIGVRP